MLCFSAFLLNAQNCTPNWPGGGPGISPDSATGLPHGVINTPYTATLQYKVPLDTTYMGLPVTITDATVTSVSGLSTIPNSVPFTYVTNPASGVFPGGSIGCALISGTPTTAGTYPLVLHVTVHIGIVPIPVNYSAYRIQVDSTAPSGIAQLKPNAFDLGQNYPNPANGNTVIAYNTPNAAEVSLKICNLLGTTVRMMSLPGKAGFNTIELNTEDLAPGIYFYTLSDGMHAMSKRMIVTK